MKRTKTKIVKFLEIDEIKNFQKPMLNEVKEALKKENLNTKDKITIRDFALINLVYACALRISEACNLELNYLDIDKMEMEVINGKGGDRLVPIPEPTIKILKLWLNIRPEWKNNNYVFTNIKGSTRPGKVRPLNYKYYDELFKKLSEKTGIKMKDGSNPHPHTLRHSRAMEIYDSINDIEILQKLLGHKDISTTQIYAQVRDEKVMEVQQSVVNGLISI
ncbi:MAG: tyrosine-type recombinase/integrase [Clostridia bacterium]